MASRKSRGPQDKSACRDLSGRRLKAVQDAQDLAKHVATQGARERAQREERRRKLEGVIERKVDGGKMEDHVYWDDRERLVEGVRSAVREAATAPSAGGNSIGLPVAVTAKPAKAREVKFTGFEEDYEDSSEEEEASPGEESDEKEST
jgi:replication stress response regulator SDE2